MEINNMIIKPDYISNNIIYIAGTDEVGRGCLAGPVVAAAVILPLDFKHESIKDSKQLSESERFKAEKIILENAIAYSIAYVDAQTIDNINILQASLLAMHKALKDLKIQPQHILVDGNVFHKYGNIPYDTIIKGDSKIYSIAAASILAKNSRDKFMHELHEKYPEYCWNTNVGYGTQKHINSILDFGICEYHRKTFCKKFIV